MIKLIIAFLLFATISQAQSLRYEFNHLSKSQITILKQACTAGISDNLCLTLSSIAWQESDLGLYQINLQDPSAGIYHIKISTAMSYLNPKIRNTPFNRNRVAMWLINYPKWAAKLAIAQLKFWLKYWRGNWFEAVGSYNGGYRSNKEYARDIVKRVRFLRKHIKF